MRRATWVFGLMALPLLAAGTRVSHGDVGNPGYLQTVEKWRKGYEASLRSDEGWLTVAGLYWLHDGDNSFGSDPLNDIVVSSEQMPAKAGVFEFRNGKTTVHVSPGSKFTMNGKAVESAALQPDSPTDRLRLGDLTLYLHASGTRYAIRLKDKNSRIRREFTGLNWFPVDESYRATGRYTPYNPPKQTQVQTVMGDFDKVAIVGNVTFTLHGVEYRLDAEQDGPTTLEFVFRDLTSGKETYGAARFLDTDGPKDGVVVMDFNEAYNPPCAYNPYTTCPLPTPENRLRVAIPAGEKIYQHH
jgi:uncharacterized protein (DUF1684 family)